MVPKLRVCHFFESGVRWESVLIRIEAEGVTHSGAFRSENVGTSNRNGGENPPRRKSKVSYSMIIRVGLVGPKGMAIAGPDGQQVNIPALRLYAMERRRVVYKAHYWIWVEYMRV